MYFVTLKFTRRKAAAAVAALAIVLILLVLIFGAGSDSTALDTTEERVEYLRGLGREADPGSETGKNVLIPREFTGVYLDYNKLQKEQGFDLENYAGCEVEMYSYMLTNYNSGENVVATLYISDGEVIGGDVHSTSLGGFMHGLK